jgi:DNA polymerase I-like protein with 3'-5' exonuclease and polymerase domains
VLLRELHAGLDMHQYNAEEFFKNSDAETRQIAKVFSFRISNIVPSSRNTCRKSG